MDKKEYKFIKIERPEFKETEFQILQDIKSIDSEITIEEKRAKVYKEELIKELKKMKRDEIPTIPNKITLWMKIKFLFTGKWH